MSRQSLNNQERLFQSRYREARTLLATDADAAERAFISLLTEASMPLWMRGQCNAILAGITNEASDADKYLADARHVLELFKEGRPDPDPLQGDIDSMTARLGKIEESIEDRRKNPWTEQKGEEKDAGKDSGVEARDEKVDEEDKVVADKEGGEQDADGDAPKAK